MSACPYCGCKTTNSKTTGAQFRRVCTACGAEGPPAMTDEHALLLWDRRPAENFWKRLAAYLGSIHAANASDYEAKAVSHSRRDRQISILYSVSRALRNGEMPEGAAHGITTNVDEAVAAAGKRALDEHSRLVSIRQNLKGIV